MILHYIFLYAKSLKSSFIYVILPRKNQFVNILADCALDSDGISANFTCKKHLFSLNQRKFKRKSFYRRQNSSQILLCRTFPKK